MDKELIMNSLSQKKKIVFPKYTIIALILSVICLGMYGIVNLLDKRDIQMYLLGVGSTEINIILIFVCTTSFLSALSVFFYKNSAYKIIVVIIMVVVFIVHLWFWSVTLLWGRATYHEFTSSDKEHTVIFYREFNLDLFSDFYSADIYEKTSFCTMKKVGHFYIPSNCGSYYFVWNDEDFEMHFSCETEHEHEPITIAYIK